MYPPISNWNQDERRVPLAQLPRQENPSQIGAVDQYNAIPHIHLSVHSTNWQGEIIDPIAPIEWGQHWGMAKGITQELAESTATTYTVNPVHAYALYKGYDVTP